MLSRFMPYCSGMKLNQTQSEVMSLIRTGHQDQIPPTLRYSEAVLRLLESSLLVKKGKRLEVSLRPESR